MLAVCSVHNLNLISRVQITNIFFIHMSTVQLLGPMHKYKRAEVVYDHLDLVFVIIELLSKTSGGREIKRKMVKNEMWNMAT